MVGPFKQDTAYLLVRISPELSRTVEEIQTNPQASDAEKMIAGKINQIINSSYNLILASALTGLTISLEQSTSTIDRNFSQLLSTSFFYTHECTKQIKLLTTNVLAAMNTQLRLLLDPNAPEVDWAGIDEARQHGIYAIEQFKTFWHAALPCLPLIPEQLGMFVHFQKSIDEMVDWFKPLFLSSSDSILNNPALMGTLPPERKRSIRPLISQQAAMFSHTLQQAHSILTKQQKTLTEALLLSRTPIANHEVLLIHIIGSAKDEDLTSLVPTIESLKQEDEKFAEQYTNLQNMILGKCSSETIISYSKQLEKDISSKIKLLRGAVNRCFQFVEASTISIATKKLSLL